MRTGLHNDLYVSATKSVKTKLLKSNPRRVGVSWKWLRAAQWVWKYMHIAGMGTIRGYDEKTHQSDGLLQPSQNTFVPLTGHPILTMASCAKMGHHGTPWDTSQTSFSLQYSEMRRIVPSCFSRSFERSYSMTLRVAICSTVALADTTDWLGPPVSYHFASRRLSGLPRSVIDHWYSI